MRRMVEKIIRNCGTALTLEKNGERISITAFLQPNGAASQINTRTEMSPLGQVPGGRYLYIGPVTPQAEVGDVLTLNGRRFELRRAETVMSGEEPLYRWGLCVEKGGMDPWT